MHFYFLKTLSLIFDILGWLIVYVFNISKDCIFTTPQKTIFRLEHCKYFDANL